MPMSEVSSWRQTSDGFNEFLRGSWPKGACPDRDVLEVSPRSIELKPNKRARSLLAEAIVEMLKRTVKFQEVVSMDDLLLDYYDVHVNVVAPGRLVRLVVQEGETFTVAQAFYIDEVPVHLDLTVEGPYKSPLLRTV